MLTPPSYQCRGLQQPYWETLSCSMFRAYMLSALITSVRGYPAMPLAEQLAHYWHVQLGPLVLKSGLLKFPNAHSR